ncbi:MAG: ABC transporter substrate-binding protein [Thiotrichaceae bacterium]|nr:ABC transporter substrate-binding protein [Thiotrichaceae bacterium]
MKVKIYLFLGLLLVVLASCSPSSTPISPLKIGIHPGWPTPGAAFVAQEKGLFTKHGVEVTLMPIVEYNDIKKFYREGKIDIAFMVFTDAIMFESEATSAHFVYAIDYSDSGDVIIGRPTLDGLNDLKGKKVSFEGFNSFSHFLVLKLLEQAGLNEGDFQAANIESSKVLDALENGEVDAGHIYGIPISEALEKGYKVIEKAGKIPYSIMDGWVVSTETIKTRKKEVQAVINALAEATDLLAQSPEESLSIMAKYMSVPKEELEIIYQGLHIFTSQENQEAFKSDGLLLKGGKEIVDFFYQKGGLIKIPDLNTIVDDQFIVPIKNNP